MMMVISSLSLFVFRGQIQKTGEAMRRKKSYGAFLAHFNPTQPYRILFLWAMPGAAGRMWTETETTNSQGHLDT